MIFRLDAAGVQAKDVKAALEKELKQLFLTTCPEEHPARGQVSRQALKAIEAACALAAAVGKPGASLNVSVACHGDEAHIEGLSEHVSIAVDEVTAPAFAPLKTSPLTTLSAPLTTK